MTPSHDSDPRFDRDQGGGYRDPMTTNYHHHDYGVGRLLSRWYWGGIIVFLLWTAVVLIVNYPLIFLGGCAIIGACILIEPLTTGRRVTAKRRGKHGA